MQPRSVSVAVTTVADGSATAYSEAIQGRILAIQYVKDDFAAGVDFDVTLEDSEQELWDEDNVDADKTVYPRRQVHDTVGAGLTYDGTRTVNEPVVTRGAERVKIVIAAGGNAKNGTFHITYG